MILLMSMVVKIMFHAHISQWHLIREHLAFLYTNEGCSFKQDYLAFLHCKNPNLVHDRSNRNNCLLHNNHFYVLKMCKKNFSSYFVSLTQWKITFYWIIPGSSLSFEVDEKPAFIVPLKDVCQATTGWSVILLFMSLLLSGLGKWNCH